jgi:uncharacterized protein YbjT (DUF2867 family)
MRLALYCSCGAAWTGDVAPSFAAKAKREFNGLHTYPECGPATAEEATRARAQAEADEARRRSETG